MSPTAKRPPARRPDSKPARGPARRAAAKPARTAAAGPRQPTRVSAPARRPATTRRPAAPHPEREALNEFLDVLDALVIELDPAGRIVSFNRACEELSG